MRGHIFPPLPVWSIRFGTAQRTADETIVVERGVELRKRNKKDSKNSRDIKVEGDEIKSTFLNYGSTTGQCLGY